MKPRYFAEDLTWRRGDKKSNIDHFVIRNLHDSLNCKMKKVEIPHLDNKPISDHSAITLKISKDISKSPTNPKLLFDRKQNFEIKKEILVAGKP